jgi:nicotinamide-nucleotide amidase
MLSGGTTVALAESCTGGLIAGALSEIPGASGFLWGGAVVYTAAAKLALTDLPESVLAAHGVVSAVTTEALAVAVRQRAGSTFGLAVTGWAGPTAEDGGAVGEVYGAFADHAGSTSEAWIFAGDRHQVRVQAAAATLDLLRRRLDATHDDGYE